MPLQACCDTIDRRDFLNVAGASLVAAAMPGGRRLWSAEPVARPRIAAILTEYRGYSHADVILGRFLQGYILGPMETHWPRTQVVSMYVDQFPAGDLSRGMASQYGLEIKPYLSGKETYTAKRTLLTTGILDAVMTSRFEGHRRIEIPWLAEIKYQITNDTARRAMF